VDEQGASTCNMRVIQQAVDWLQSTIPHAKIINGHDPKEATFMAVRELPPLRLRCPVSRNPFVRLNPEHLALDLVVRIGGLVAVDVTKRLLLQLATSLPRVDARLEPLVGGAIRPQTKKRKYIDATAELFADRGVVMLPDALMVPFIDGPSSQGPVMLAIGFGDHDPSAYLLNREAEDDERHVLRSAFGYSHSTATRSLPRPVLETALALRKQNELPLSLCLSVAIEAWLDDVVEVTTVDGAVAAAEARLVDAYTTTRRLQNALLPCEHFDNLSDWENWRPRK